MRYTLLLSSLTLVLASPGFVLAQGTTSSGMFGNRTTGNGTSAGTSSAFGSNSALSALSQSNGQGSPTLNSANGIGGQARQAGSFVGANSGQAAQQGFVGAAQANPTGAGGTGGMGGGAYGSGGFGAGYGGMGGGFGGRGLGQALMEMRANNGNTMQPPPVRTQLTLGFEPAAAPAASEVSSSIAAHLAALPALHWQGPVQVQMQGHTAILLGMAATEHDRDLAERVVRLEATVDRVDNRLAIVGQSQPRFAPPVQPILPELNSAQDNSVPGNSAADNSAPQGPVQGNSAAGSSAVSNPVPRNSAAHRTAGGNFGARHWEPRSPAAGNFPAPVRNSPTQAPRGNILPPPVKPAAR